MLSFSYGGVRAFNLIQRNESYDSYDGNCKTFSFIADKRLKRAFLHTIKQSEGKDVQEFIFCNLTTKYLRKVAGYLKTFKHFESVGTNHESENNLHQRWLLKIILVQKAVKFQLTLLRIAKDEIHFIIFVEFHCNYKYNK